MFTAKDILTNRFHTLSPDISLAEATKRFAEASREEGRRIFGMIVIDESGTLRGMLSMYDILLFIRPKHVQVWGTMEDIDVSGLLDVVSERARSVTVEEIMTTEVLTVTPDTHVMTILDIMLRKHIRRIPVVHDGKIDGMVYLSDLFYFLVDRLSD